MINNKYVKVNSTEFCLEMINVQSLNNLSSYTYSRDCLNREGLRTVVFGVAYGILTVYCMCEVIVR